MTDEMELFEQAREIELAKQKEKSAMVEVREYVERRSLAMKEKMMDAIEMALESEDEKIRVDAAFKLLSKSTPTVAPERAETEEVIEVTSKATLEEVQLMIERKLKEDKKEKG